MSLQLMSDGDKMTRISHRSGEEYIVHAKAVSGDGTGVCDIGGVVALVRGILPGECARVRLTDVRDSYAKAELIELRGRLNDRRGAAPIGALFG